MLGEECTPVLCSFTARQHWNWCFFCWTVSITTRPVKHHNHDKYLSFFDIFNRHPPGGEVPLLKFGIVGQDIGVLQIHVGSVHQVSIAADPHHTLGGLQDLPVNHLRFQRPFCLWYQVSWFVYTGFVIFSGDITKWL